MPHCLERLGEQLSSADFTGDAFQRSPELVAARLQDEQFEGFLQRQARLRKRQELLVEDQEVIGRDLFSPQADHAISQPPARLDGEDVVALSRQAVAKLRLGGGLLRLRGDLPRYAT